MLRRRKKLIFALSLVGVAFTWLLTRGNAVWRIHRHYPSAFVYFDPPNSPDLSWGDLVRVFGISFYSGGEPIGIELADATVAFDHFRGMTIGGMTLVRCRVTDVRPLLTQYHPYVTFQDCDLSALPPDQIRYLEQRPDFPSTYSIGNLTFPFGSSHGYPGVTALHDYSLFP